MIKYEADGLRIWVDQDSGSLKFQTEMSSHEISFNDAGRIIGLIQQDRAIFKEELNKRNSTWNRIMKRFR